MLTVCRLFACAENEWASHRPTKCLLSKDWSVLQKPVYTTNIIVHNRLSYIVPTCLLCPDDATNNLSIRDWF